MRAALLALALLAACEDDRRARDRPEPIVIVRQELKAQRDTTALDLRVDVTPDRVTVTWPGAAPRVIERNGRTSDAVGLELEGVLRALRDTTFPGRTDLQMTVAPDTTYPDLVALMDHAINAGFTDVGLAP